MSGEAPPVARDGGIEGRLADILREVAGDPGLVVEPGMALDGIPGWDSVSLVGAMLRIEDEFGIEFQANEFVAIHTVGDVARVVASMLD
ncbi:MAG: acyl carrier protein [Janthinobacterium lividum]